MKTRITDIKTELRDICTPERLRDYAASDQDSLGYYRSLVETRIGRVSNEEWDAACAAIARATND